jgi:hypothetical protein
MEHVMPKIIVRAETPDGEAASITLSERLAADNLDSDHYAAQLIERITWAARDAQALEADVTGARALPARARSVPVTAGREPLLR